MRDIFPDLIGNSAIKSLAQSAAETDFVSHSIILCGPDGSGKHTAALLLSASLLCENRKNGDFSLPCKKCEACRRIFSAIHPDVVHFGLTGDRKTIGVDTARDIRSQLYIAPNESETKIFIIDDADKMTPQAQNALLLSLEEPPHFVKFILIAEEVSKILATVKSRSLILKNEILSDALIHSALQDSAKGSKLCKTNPELFDKIIKMSSGILGRAKKLLGASGTQTSDSTPEDIARVLLGGSAEEKVNLINSLPKERAKLIDYLSAAEIAIRDIAMCKLHHGAQMLYYTDTDEAIQIARHTKQSKIISAVFAIENAKADLNNNIFHVTVKENLFFGMK